MFILLSIMASKTPLVSVLRFKNLNARLTDTEFDTFMCRMWRIAGREECLKMLCTQFLNESNNAVVANEEEPSLLIEMTRITSDIIQDRKTKSHPSIKPNITNIPCTLIGTIASFLHQIEYIIFSMTNRKVYVDCNSPNTLQRLTLLPITDYSIVPLKQFPQIKQLMFNLKQISEIKVIQGQRFGHCNQLETLRINGLGSTTADIDLLLKDSSRCFSSIQSLALVCFIGRARLAAKVLIQILSKFENLTHFQMFGVEIRGRLNSHSLSLVCPEIKEFVSIVSGHIGHVLQSWKGRIETLTVGNEGAPDRDVDIPNYDISAVKRLCLVGLKVAQIDSLLNLSKTLQQISWIPNVKTPPQPSLNGQQIENVIKRCIVDQVPLEYLYISTRGHFEAICSGIHKGLYSTKKRKRKQLEIALNVDIREIVDVEEFVSGISRIINVIGMTNVKEWIICVDAHTGLLGSTGQQCFDWKPMKVALEDLLQSLQMKVQLVKGTDKGFVLGNGDKMKRHDIWWSLSGHFKYY